MSQSLTRLATARLLNGGPETCNRVEREVLAAINKAEWSLARRLLHRRLQMRRAPNPEERNTIDRILELIDEAEAKGIGPDPYLRDRCL